ncbi:hypothetical protein E4U53_007927 [Claviceps sorghi]|nr:hypothetical protein E4U53_007927 [Claviceps sorghi]
MTGRGGGGGRRVLLPPINMIFKLLQSVVEEESNARWRHGDCGVRQERLLQTHVVAPCEQYYSKPDHMKAALMLCDLACQGSTSPLCLEPFLYRYTLRGWGNATVSVWLYEQLSIRIEGKIRGFDEFMNLVIDDAVEVAQVTKTNEQESRRPLDEKRAWASRIAVKETTTHARERRNASLVRFYQGPNSMD